VSDFNFAKWTDVTVSSPGKNTLQTKVVAAAVRLSALRKLLEADAALILVLKIVLTNLSHLSMNHCQWIEHVRDLYTFEPPRPFERTFILLLCTSI